jgi:DNA repair exonuclease SbcCD ATPase subunit
MLDATEKIEEELTDIIKKECEKRKDEIEKYTDERIKLLQKEKDAYNEMRDEQEYDKSIREQTNEIAELQKQIDIARKDQSLSGQKKLQELIKEMEEAQKKLQETTQDKIDEDYNNNIDKEIEHLEDEEEKLISILDEKFSDENIAKMIQQGLTSGFIELNGEIMSIQELLTKSVDESAQAYSVMANVIKNELITNLNVALSTMEDLSKVYSSLGIENFGSALNANASSLSIPNLGGSKTENKITVGDTNITIQGSIDNATLEEIEALIDQKNKRMLEEITSGL